MKKLITNYTFVPGLSGIGYVQLNDYTTINSSLIKSIRNITRGVTLYDFEDEILSIDTRIITTIDNKVYLNQQTTSHSSTDKLQIWIEESDVAPLSSNIGNSQTGSYTLYRNENLLATVQTVKSTAGNVYGVNFINNNTVPVYVKFFNSTSVTLGVTTPVETIAIPAYGVATADPGQFPYGYFDNSIKIAVTTGPLSSSTIAPNMGVIVQIKFI